MGEDDPVSETLVRVTARDKEFSCNDLNALLHGQDLDQDSIDELSASRSHITLSIEKLFWQLRPMPLTNIFHNPLWQESVFSDLDEENKRFKEAVQLFEHKTNQRSIWQHMDELAQSNPTKFQFRSSPTLSYMSIDASAAFIKYWLVYQQGQGWYKMLKDIFDWLTSKEAKRRGFEVRGEPNSGKSYIFQALLALNIAVGYVRPTKGYPFNWDLAYNKLIVCCEECYIDPADQGTIETLKDLTSGNPSPVRLKNKMTVTMHGATPFIFISNNDNFNAADTSNLNPFNSRLYRYVVRQFDGWDNNTNSNQLHPYAWIQLFKEYKFL